MSAQLQVDRIGQVGTMVQDLDAAVAFYRGRLGVKHLFTAPVTATPGAPTSKI